MRHRSILIYTKKNQVKKIGPKGRKNEKKLLSIYANLSKTLFKVKKSITERSAWGKKTSLAQKKNQFIRQFYSLSLLGKNAA